MNDGLETKWRREQDSGQGYESDEQPVPTPLTKNEVRQMLLRDKKIRVSTEQS